MDRNNWTAKLLQALNALVNILPVIDIAQRWIWPAGNPNNPNDNAIADANANNGPPNQNQAQSQGLTQPQNLPQQHQLQAAIVPQTPVPRNHVDNRFRGMQGNVYNIQNTFQRGSHFNAAALPNSRQRDSFVEVEEQEEEEEAEAEEGHDENENEGGNESAGDE